MTIQARLAFIMIDTQRKKEYQKWIVHRKLKVQTSERSVRFCDVQIAALKNVLVGHLFVYNFKNLAFDFPRNFDRKKFALLILSGKFWDQF
jgi:hypothetical protein